MACTVFYKLILHFSNLRKLELIFGAQRGFDAYIISSPELISHR